MEAPEKIYYHKGKLRTPFAVEQRLDETDIEYVHTDAFIEKACRCYCDDICEQGLCGMCFYKHDGQGQIMNTFKYNECNELKLLIHGLKEE